MGLINRYTMVQTSPKVVGVATSVTVYSHMEMVCRAQRIRNIVEARALTSNQSPKSSIFTFGILWDVLNGWQPPSTRFLQSLSLIQIWLVYSCYDSTMFYCWKAQSLPNISTASHLTTHRPSNTVVASSWQSSCSTAAAAAKEKSPAAVQLGH